MSTSILRLNEARTRTGLSRTAIYRAIAAGRFPRPLALGLRAIGWRADLSKRGSNRSPPSPPGRREVAHGYLRYLDAHGGWLHMRR